MNIRQKSKTRLNVWQTAKRRYNSTILHVTINKSEVPMIHKLPSFKIKVNFIFGLFFILFVFCIDLYYYRIIY